ncbi:hypothetical protein EPA93_42330 [Ktedonosporobacter rubrisoli]|uniref:Uncharacterized protein n=1 Tax=Ktedonosporobacter rubrisoli TaxID=2509675 RepID=A0A4P6K425_KTERU|nr:hypothetical protein [Ktedonosporobacter rubrisoli]QBD82266.1 hypothetical protein EPA93_42330 [Ktedonosporobacter rubrisoli]
MDAIIGRYRARMEDNGLVIRHASGISFDLTIDETLGLLDFINAYRQTLLIMQRDADTQRDTDPEIERIVLEREDNQ